MSSIKKRKPFQTNILGFKLSDKRWGGRAQSPVLRLLTDFEKKRIGPNRMTKFWPKCAICSAQCGCEIPVEAYKVVEFGKHHIVLEMRCHGSALDYAKIENYELGEDWWDRGTYLRDACRHVRFAFAKES